MADGGRGGPREDGARAAAAAGTACDGPTCPLCRADTLALVALGLVLALTGSRAAAVAGLALVTAGYALALLGVRLPLAQPRGAGGGAGEGTERNGENDGTDE